MIGNSRLHWAWFRDDILLDIWDSDYLTTRAMGKCLPTDCFPPHLCSLPCQQIPLYLASVVPQQTTLWETYSYSQVIRLEHIPLGNLYPTLGIDRALAVWGGGEIWGFPCLVIDAGTGLTLTGVDGDRNLVGGAILGGLRLQFQALAMKTATLPDVTLPDTLPSRWALATPTAIESGIIYTVLAGLVDFIADWWTKFPGSPVLFTGGDAKILLHYLQVQHPDLGLQLILDQNLIFWGIRAKVRQMEN
jgi:type III pantothenate kinase